jgi:hypothetical protein
MAGGDVTLVLDDVSSSGLARGIVKLMPELAQNLLPPLTSRSILGSITPSITVDWASRMAEAQSMPTLFDADVVAKYNQLATVAQDFLHCAQHWSKLIVDELGSCDVSLLFWLQGTLHHSDFAPDCTVMVAGLPMSKRTIHPVRTTTSSLGKSILQPSSESSAPLFSRGLYFESNMWLYVIRDYTGFFGGCDESAMASAGTFMSFRLSVLHGRCLQRKFAVPF